MLYGILQKKENKFDTGMKTSWFDERIEITFEGKKFYTCSQYKEYLTYMYGDYMQIPDESKREKHPASSYMIN